ncbi:helix-turn-helix domain-containing protein [Flavonifractor sp. HCP28S3_F3]|uniref:helix-turn-helix domain-containing protein n=1 Tax=Flavonifractor sp. HCP28S3_F3 TaxID=3438939 RepID=UPI003F8CCB31
MDYCHLRKEFPETISMDQLYRICHISKRKAHWLLENGIIPCRDSGKHTRRFSISLEEVIRFLELRDAGVLEEVIPHGAFSGGSSRPVCPARRELDEERLCAYLLECWQDWPDMLTTRQTAELCGYSLTTLNRWWSRGQVKGVKYRNELLYSKESLACWLASVKGQNIAVLSKQHREWMKGFQAEEQNSGMEPNSMPLF